MKLVPAVAAVLMCWATLFGARADETGQIRIHAMPPASLYKYSPMAHRDDEWFGSTFWTGPDWTRVGRDWHHPGMQTNSVRTFVAPRDGVVRVTGHPRKADLNQDGGDGVLVSIRLEGKTIWQAEIDGNDSVGKAHDLTVDIRAGQALRFVVHRRAGISYDTTFWDPLVAYAEGERFQASEGFAATLPESSPWRYEVDESADDVNSERRRRTHLYYFTPDMLLRQQVLEDLEQPLVLDARTCLPALVIAHPGGTAGNCLSLNPGSNWTITVGRPDEEDIIQVSWKAKDRAPETVSYEGHWTAALAKASVAASIEPSLVRLSEELGVRPLPASLWALVMEAWLLEDGQPDTPGAFLQAAMKHLGKCLAMGTPSHGEAIISHVKELRDARPAEPRALRDMQSFYIRARWLKREMLLSRPEMDFDTLLFAKRAPTSYSHLVMQYFGWRARPGGGLFLLKRPGYSLEAHDILQGQLDGGSVLQPCLDWDGKRIAFSYVADAGRRLSPEQVNNDEDEAFYHVWTVDSDGSDLRQRTRGAYEDLMPAWLPDGDIIFCSTRRQGYSRCFGGAFSDRWDSYTLHRLSTGDGAITRYSCNDVSEWFPVVGHDGLVYFSRWDYIDRDAVTHQNLWSMRPDGSNPMAVWGNALPSPHCTFQAQPVPGSRQFVFVASAHHSITAGSLVLLDPSVGPNALEAIQRITPEVPFPEAESRDIGEYYAAPWPLAKDLFLTAYSPYPLVWEPGANRRDALGIYLLDVAGNRELIYRDPEIGSTNPTPLRPRPRPPVIPSSLDPRMGNEGEFMVADVYEGLQGVVKRGEVKALCVIQIFPKTTPISNVPPIGLAGEENARAVLGTVPVAHDGSAYFRAPARKPLLFQLLDEEGRAVQIMRSLTYVQPGERVSCVGCHESPGTVPTRSFTEAAKRPPSELDAGPCEGEPFSFMRVVQPVLDEHCVACHGSSDPAAQLDLSGAPDRGFTKSYWSLIDAADRQRAERGLDTPPMVPRYAQRNQVQMTPPGGENGARGSLLLKMLKEGHGDLQLPETAMRRLAMWIDCNAIFYGSYLPERQKRQLAGQFIDMPSIQ